MGNAFYTGEYTNLFAQLGYSSQEIQNRVEECFNTIFFGSEEERIFHEAGDDMGYLMDTGNLDVRTEGQSYGMMMALQMNRKDIFDRIWKWTRTHMYIKSGPNKGYFGWSAQLDGTLNSNGSAPDGEEYFAMALLFAANRWGDGEGIFEYSREAKALLHEMVHKGEDGSGQPMFDPKYHYIRFTTDTNFTDPSYHLPHFYELFARWGNPQDADFFSTLAAKSRDYLKAACHPVTGLAAEYAEYDGTPCKHGNHHHFYSDSYRVAANLALDYEWFGADEWETICADNIQRFFAQTAKGKEELIYNIDGTPVVNPEELVHEIDGTPVGVLHPVGLLATNAQASLAAKAAYRMEFVRKLWDTPLRTGNRRYYDNCLYLFAMLALSGNYRIWLPKTKGASE
ncbi:glycosyl hydrolase family 8 [Acetanaerobacterium elongatum]|uniref:Oligosaccharide reducing-end xylanase n=1 Tax=Acetanaerobacterium elongatum TaxID=258515 RepID=A0A1H0DA36_9FIRM|nr:glycosyl hydrolase family 8 [Acetanaerobacterium elongatum]SDN67022.1 oligosaccharide reducing-end xylanase [Acetanaerobacterium elongatum]